MSKKAMSKKYMEKLRNIGIIAHIDAGKTTLTERILYYTEEIHRMGEVHEGMATMDYMPEEQERGITITSACTTCLWKGATINIIDTPGHVDFTIEVERCLRVLDGAVGVFCAVGGVEPQSETVWRQSEKFHIPKLAFVNKMDRLGADFDAVLQAMRDKLKAKPLPLQIPVGQGQDFIGTIDLLTMQRLDFDRQSLGRSYTPVPLTEEEAAYAAPWREHMVETLAEDDEELLELYLGGEELPLALLQQAVRTGTQQQRFRSGVCRFRSEKYRRAAVDGRHCLLFAQPSGSLRTHKVSIRSAKRRKTLVPLPDGDLAALVFKVSMETGRKLILARLYSGNIQAGQSVYNLTRDVDERVARIFHLHAGQKEKADAALAGDIVALAGLKHARTGRYPDHPSEARVVLESIAGYKPVISLALEPKNTAEGDRLKEVLDKCVQEDPTLFFEEDQETGQLLLSGNGRAALGSGS